MLSTSTKSIKKKQPLGVNMPFERSCLVKCGLQWNPAERVMIGADGEWSRGSERLSPAGLHVADDFIKIDGLRSPQ